VEAPSPSCSLDVTARKSGDAHHNDRDGRFKAEDASKEREATEDDALGLGGTRSAAAGQPCPN
jgi:hypothetical protein